MFFHQVYWKSSSRTKIYVDDSLYFVRAKRNSIIISSDIDLQNQVKLALNEYNTTESKQEESVMSPAEINIYGREFPPTLPFSKTTLPAEQLLQMQWVKDLQMILSDISRDSPPVHIIAGNYEYHDVLLNWLITAKVRVNPPVTNVIILSIDTPLCELLSMRNITCLHIDQRHIFKTEMTIAFRLILELRLTVIRLLNYWGYDAANIDTDALVLKNPEVLYDAFKDSDIVAGRGIFPLELGSKWGGTICGGTFTIRSSAKTGKLATTLSVKTKLSWFSPQNSVRCIYIVGGRKSYMLRIQKL